MENSTKRYDLQLRPFKKFRYNETQLSQIIGTLESHTGIFSSSSTVLAPLTTFEWSALRMLMRKVSRAAIRALTRSACRLKLKTKWCWRMIRLKKLAMTNWRPPRPPTKKMMATLFTQKGWPSFLSWPPYFFAYSWWLLIRYAASSSQ